MHSKSDNIEIIVSNKADEVIEKLFKSFLNILYWIENINKS